MKQVFKNLLAPLLLGALALSADALFAKKLATDSGVKIETPADQLFDEAEVLNKAADEKESAFAPQVKVPVVVTLKTAAEVSGPHIYFKDIGSCSGHDSVCEEMLGVEIEESALPGTSRMLPLEKVKHILAQEFPGHEINFNDVKNIKIFSQYMEVGKDFIQTQLRDALDAVFKDEKDVQVELIGLQMAKSIKIWPGDYRWRFPLLENAHAYHFDWVTENLLGSKHLFAECYADGETSPSMRIKVSPQIVLRKMLPITKTHLQRDEVLKHEQFEYQWVEVTRAGQDYISEITQLVGLKLRQEVNSGSPLTLRQVATPVLIRRGQLVHIVLKKGDLNLTGNGKALGSGSAGQMIPVMYPATKKQIQAQVVNSSTVEVAF